MSLEFRRGILDGFYATDGGNSDRIYTTSKNLAHQMEAMLTTMGIQTIIDVSNRTDEKVVVRGKEFNRNFPLYCIRWYEPKINAPWVTYTKSCFMGLVLEYK